MRLPPYSGPFALGRPHHASTPRQGARPQGLERVEGGGILRSKWGVLVLFLWGTGPMAIVPQVVRRA